jgi:transposase InsO family protein
VELALAEAERLIDRPLHELAPRDTDSSITPMVTIVTDNAGPFRSFRFEAFIATHPENRHVRTRVRTPGQNGSRERGFGTLKYERLFLEEIEDVLDLTVDAERYRVDYNTVRPHEALAWNRPHDVHIGQADPRIPNFPEPEILPTA